MPNELNLTGMAKPSEAFLHVYVIYGDLFWAQREAICAENCFVINVDFARSLLRSLCFFLLLYDRSNVWDLFLLAHCWVIRLVS